MRAAPADVAAMERNVALYRWHRFGAGLMFWQAVWFLFYQAELSAAHAILLYAVYDVGTTVMEVPSGYMSDRLGRRLTLICSAIAGFVAAVLLVTGNSFAAFVLANLALGASAAFASGTGEALLYESLAAAGRAEEIERQELISWRFLFSAHALSAVTGGAMALMWDRLPFVASAVAFAFVLLITLRLTEPPHAESGLPQGDEVVHFESLRQAFTSPVLLWLFVLAVLMYGFSHVPFVFGQPFILEALEAVGLSDEAPLVSGGVSATMMVVSVLASLGAVALRGRLGLPGVLCLAFGMQIVLIAVMGATDSWIVIAFLFLRMVPDALSRPFILGRIQPLLRDDSRATYLSLQSFAGRLAFAASLWIAALSTSDVGLMPYADIQVILGWYVLIGGLALASLILLARPARVTPAAE